MTTRVGIVTKIITTTEKEMLEKYGQRFSESGDPQWDWLPFGLEVYDETNQQTYFIHFRDLCSRENWDKYRSWTIPGLEYSDFEQKYRATPSSKRIDRLTNLYHVGKQVQFVADDAQLTGKIYPIAEHFTSPKKYAKYLKSQRN